MTTPEGARAEAFETLDDFRALSLDDLNAWLRQHNDSLAALHQEVETQLHTLGLAYRVLKEKMAKPPRVS